MDEIQRLEEQLRWLRQEMGDLERQAANDRQNLVEENKRQLLACRTEMERTLQSHDRSTADAFEKLVADYQRKLNANLNLELSNMDEQYRRLVSAVEASRAQIEKKNRELAQAVEQLKFNSQNKEKTGSTSAIEYLRESQQALSAVEQKPHEKFAPNRLGVFSRSIQDAIRLFQSGLYEAAMGVAISAKAGLERLGFSIDEDVDNWEAQFELLSIKTKYLSARLDEVLSEWEKHTALEGTTRDLDRTMAEVDHWTYGEFSKIYKAVADTRQLVNLVKSTGEKTYLKTPQSVGTERISEMATALDALSSRLSAACPLHISRFEASCQRSEYADRLISYFTNELNCIWKEENTGYREPAEEVRTSEPFITYMRIHYGDNAPQEDDRQWLRVDFIDSGDNTIHIYILPVETSTEVKNQVMLTIDSPHEVEESYVQVLSSQIEEAVQNRENRLVYYVPDAKTLRASPEKALRDLGRDMEQVKGKRFK